MTRGSMGLPLGLAVLRRLADRGEPESVPSGSNHPAAASPTVRTKLTGFLRGGSPAPVILVVVASGLWAGCGEDGPAEPAAPEVPRPTTVQVSPASAVLVALGDTVRLAATVLDQNGQTMAGASVSWSSGDASVATVDGSGLLTSAGNGGAVITAVSGEAAGSAAVTVAQRVAQVRVSPDSVTLVALGDMVRLDAEAVDANGHAVASAEFAWSSGDTLVAVVDGSGRVTSAGAGTVEITATSSGMSGRATVTVVAPEPTTVVVIPHTVALTALGETAQLAAEVSDQIGRVMASVPLSWLSADTTVAAVDSAGLVTAAGVGEATITATSGDASGEAVVTVMQSAGSVIVSPAADTVAQGESLQLVAEAFDKNGHRVEGAQFSWSSSAVSVAWVDYSGLVAGIAEGTATITATAGAARGTAEITVANPDRAALVALHNATDGPNWVDDTNWLTDAPLGEWYGVSTDGSGRVIELEVAGGWTEETGFYQAGLTGPIPPELGNLSSLRILNLRRNALTGAIPPELGNLANLERLDLRVNDLTGAIPPELGNLASLESLSFSSNDLTGPIPPELGNLANLELLYLYSNDLTGPIPTELGSLANLELLSLNSNALIGAIPPELGNLANLELLYLYSNALTGPIPTELGSLANLELLSFNGNALTGAIPPELGNLAKLRSLWLGRNQLTGPIPPELGTLASLSSLSLSGNDLTGPIPQGFLELRQLKRLWIEKTGICVPGTSAFKLWIKQMENYEGSVLCNAGDVAALGALYEATGGKGWTAADGWLSDRAVEEWHGVAADSLGHVTELDLARNGLAGEITPTLSGLTRMTVLRIGDNDLSGRLPLGLTGLPLVEFRYRGTQLCAPADVSFQRWVNGISSYEGTGEECAPLSDREILEIFYKATDGPNWSNNNGWLTDAPLAEWRGVSVDHEGRVVRLSLARNDLAGPIPPELGNLANLELLHLDANDLAGPIPPDLGNLANLERLFLVDNALTGPIPPELGNLGNLRLLLLWANALTGPIPPELGSLAHLIYLRLSTNALTGPIPPELGKLANLESLWLDRNALTGPIPPELGDLANLEDLWLFNNALTGSIPPELGDLANLSDLSLSTNALTGPIPPELGDLANLESLWLDRNALTGPIPPELGDLANLEDLGLFNNALTGPIPPGLGGMTRLTRARFSHNHALAGPLPADMTSLRDLEVLLASRTSLCVPMDGGFREWLAGMRKTRIPNCRDAGLSAAHLTQAVQSWDFPVPLVAGRNALLRVFPTASRTTSEGIPAVRARFYVDGRETHVEEIPGSTVPIPIQVDEGDLSKSANAEIAGHVIQPGLEMVIEVDPGGTLDAALGVAKRIPATGRMAVEVEPMPVFDLTLIPFVWTETHDSSIVELVDAMAADPENHEMLGDTRELLPIGELSVTAHEPVLSSSNNAYALLRETRTIRIMEGRTGHYKGMMSRPVTGAGGVAYWPGRSSFSQPYPFTLAHELGHNFSLGHAPCGGPSFLDPSYPHDGGTIGAWGYDFDEARLVPPARRDLMSYCGSKWISDYHFTNALRYRLFDEGMPDAAASLAPSKSLLLWGGASADGVPFLESSFVVDAIASLPDSAGEYRLDGRNAEGRSLFSLNFAMPHIADGDGSSSFVFALPVRPGWEALAEITLTGPDGSATLDGDTDRTMAMIRNPRTGQVRGFLRDVPSPTRAAMDAAGQVAGQGLEVLFSRGIPSAEAWRR